MVSAEKSHAALTSSRAAAIPWPAVQITNQKRVLSATNWRRHRSRGIFQRRVAV